MTDQTSQTSHWLSSKFEPAQSWWEDMRVDESWRSNESEGCDSHPTLIQLSSNSHPTLIQLSSSFDQTLSHKFICCVAPEHSLNNITLFRNLLQQHNTSLLLQSTLNLHCLCQWLIPNGRLWCYLQTSLGNNMADHSSHHRPSYRLHISHPLRNRIAFFCMHELHRHAGGFLGKGT